MTAAIPFVNPRPRYFDSNGDPLSSGVLEFYEANTDTAKEVYTDHTEATPATNPHMLDADGYVRVGGLWLGEGPVSYTHLTLPTKRIV